MDRCPSPTQEGFGSHRWHFEPTSAFYLFGDSPYFGSIMTGNSVASEKYWAMAQIGDRSKKENVNLGRMHLEFLKWRKIPETLIRKIVDLPARQRLTRVCMLILIRRLLGWHWPQKHGVRKPTLPLLLRWDICQNPPAPSIGPKNPDWRRLEAGSCKMRHRANLLPRLFARTRSDSCVICRWFTTICFKHYHLWQKQGGHLTNNDTFGKNIIRCRKWEKVYL